MQYEEIFDASYERVLRLEVGGRGFFDAFYENFTRTSPQARAKFEKTDMDRQKKMLKKSFYSLVVFYATNSADDYLVDIAERHSRDNLDIPPNLYDLWLETLILTVAQYDEQFDDDVELAWRLVLSTGITYMKYKYDHP